LSHISPTFSGPLGFQEGISKYKLYGKHVISLSVSHFFGAESHVRKMDCCFFGPGNPHISQPKVPLVSGDFPTDPLVWTMTLAVELIHQLTEIWTRFRRLRQGTSSETWSKWGAMAHGLLGIPSSMLHGNPPSPRTKKARNITICRWLNTVWS
jgi:hypothetical protein